MGKLQDKVIVVTGAGRGLGLAIAKACAAEGGRIVLAARSEDAIADGAEAIREAGGRATHMACDVGDLDAVRALAELAVERMDGLDVWVNDAGTSGPYGPTVDIDPEAFERVVRTNVLGTYHGSIVALRRFRAQGHGKLINLLGRGDKKPVANQTPYTASKAWVHSFTRSLAKEMDGTGIEVMAVNPGLVDTAMLRRVDAIEGFEEKVLPLATVMQLWAVPPEVPAAKIAWMASAATDGKNGLVVQELGAGRIVGGALGYLGRKLTGRLGEKPKLEIRSTPRA